MELVLSLHGIGLPHDGVGDDERRFWMPADLFEPYVEQALASARRAGVAVVFTFDDGNRSDLAIAAPALKRLGASAVFFPCVERIGQARYLAADDLRALRAQGFAVGSHGLAHTPWNRLSYAGLFEEIAGSRHRLSHVIGADVEEAAIPFGAYNRATLAMLRQAGYRRVYCSDPGVSPAGRWLCRRWTWSVDHPVQVEQVLSRSGQLPFRMATGLKQIVKRLR